MHSVHSSYSFFWFSCSGYTSLLCFLLRPRNKIVYQQGDVYFRLASFPQNFSFSVFSTPDTMYCSAAVCHVYDMRDCCYLNVSSWNVFVNKKSCMSQAFVHGFCDLLQRIADIWFLLNSQLCSWCRCWSKKFRFVSRTSANFSLKS